MTHAGTSDLHAAGNGTPRFTAGEWDALQAEDRRAARSIVVLMVSIFTLGLLGYLTIDLLIR